MLKEQAQFGERDFKGDKREQQGWCWDHEAPTRRVGKKCACLCHL